MSNVQSPCPHAWQPTHEKWPRTLGSQFAIFSLAILVSVVILGAFLWVVIQSIANIETDLSVSDRVIFAAPIIGALVTYFGFVLVNFISQNSPDKDDEEAQVQRYEERVLGELPATSSLRQRGFFGLRSNLSLPHPPGRPRTYKRERTSNRPGSNKNYVCTCCFMTQQRDPKVEVRWIKAQSLKDTFDFLASSHGWAPIGCKACEQNVGAIFETRDYLVLIELENCEAVALCWYRHPIRWLRRWIMRVKPHLKVAILVFFVGLGVGLALGRWLF